MSGQHTPGPWYYAPTGPSMREGYSQPYAIACSGGPLVAGVFGDIPGGDTQARANALLLRAAPDLLEAAKALRAAQRAYLADRGNEDLGKAVGEAAAALDAAIAKATTP